MAVFTRTKTWVSNEVLTASDLNAEFNNLLNNTIPASIEDYSADVATMQSTADPGGSGTESLATTLAGEITRLRYKIKQLMNGTYWYSTPVGSLSTGGISTAALATNSVTTIKITDANVTRAKLEAVGQQLSSSSGSFTTSSTSATDVTNLSISLTTTGRPFVLELVATASATDTSYVRIGANSAQSVYEATVYVTDAANTVIARHVFGTNVVGGASDEGMIKIPASSFRWVFTTGAATYNYKIRASVFLGDLYIGIEDVKLLAYEL